jgi:hypothetical protein
LHAGLADVDALAGDVLQLAGFDAESASWQNPSPEIFRRTRL